MKSRVVPAFWKCFNRIPQSVQAQAKNSYALFSENPNHPNLQSKSIRRHPDASSVRISKDYRALRTRDGDRITWFWIGSHSDYLTLIQRMR